MIATDTTYLLLAGLYQHRMGTTQQLHDLLGTGRHINATRIHLQQLKQQQLAQHIVLPRPGAMGLWFLTAAGRDLAATLPEVRDQDHPPVTGDVATSVRLRAPHTLAVLRTHLAFLADARSRDDDYGPLDWMPEVYHRLSETRGDALVADALMRYTANRPAADDPEQMTRTQLRAFVEVDRCTMSSERLASKLMTYGRFLDYAPAPASAGRRGATRPQTAHPVWLRHYPVFPRVLFVLTGASRAVMEHRIRDLQAMAAGNAMAARLAQKVPLGAAILDDLEEPALGPSAPVWTPLVGEDLSARGWTEL